MIIELKVWSILNVQYAIEDVIVFFHLFEVGGIVMTSGNPFHGL